MRDQEILGMIEAYASIYASQEEVELDEARRADKEGHERGTAANPTRAQTDTPHGDPSQRTMLHSRLKSRADQLGRERRSSTRYRQGGRPALSKKEKDFLRASDRTSPAAGKIRNPNVADTGSHDKWGSDRRAKRDPKQNPMHNANKQTTAESYDLFDYILEYLVAEGYADTNRAAIAIMSNMSEEWRQSIIEAVGIVGPPSKAIDAIPGVRAARNWASDAVKASDYSQSEKINKTASGRVIPQGVDPNNAVDASPSTSAAKPTKPTPRKDPRDLGNFIPGDDRMQIGRAHV